MEEKKEKSERGIQERISRVATKIFCRKGYGATSVSEIVKRAGVTKPVLYYYFGSKAGLFNQLFERHFVSFREMLERAIQLEGTTKEKVLHLTAEQFEFCRKHLDRVRFIMNTVLGPQKGIPQVRFPEMNRINSRLFSQILTKGIERGEIRPLPIDELGLAYIGIVNMFLLRQLCEKRWILDRGVAERVTEIYFSGINTSTSPNAPSHQQGVLS